MLAVHTSDLEPLPHQIQAVYGELLGRRARHLLLITATPHAGREEDFQLFLALLDTDRFEDRYRDAVHTVNTDGLMRRMVKEDLKTFDGRPLFPERRTYTVAYQLSDAEQDLYEAVTQYVREEMTNADELKEAGDLKRGATVGFALTVLQRRSGSCGWLSPSPPRKQARQGQAAGGGQADRGAHRREPRRIADVGGTAGRGPRQRRSRRTRC